MARNIIISNIMREFPLEYVHPRQFLKNYLFSIDHLDVKMKSWTTTRGFRPWAPSHRVLRPSDCCVQKIHCYIPDYDLCFLAVLFITLGLKCVISR